MTFEKLPKSVLNGLFILTLIFIFGACDTKKKLDKMSSTTEKMGETTESMKNTTEKLSSTTDGMSESTKKIETTSETISLETQNLFIKNREGTFVLNQKQQMDVLEQNPAPGRKVDAAVEWLCSMEFQHWDSRFENQTQREALYLKAVDHFFLHILPLIPDDMPVTNYFPSNEWVMLSAVSVAMSRVHPDQVDDAKKHNYAPMGLYDILKIGLAAQATHDAGLPVPEFARRVLQHKKEIYYLLQLRHNFFKALVLGELSNFEEDYILNANRLWMLLIGWSVNLDDYDNDKLSEFNEFLWKALETQDYLLTLKQQLEHNKAITDIYGKGTFWTNKRPGTLAAPLRVNGKLMPLEQAIEVRGSGFFLHLLKDVLRAPAPPVVRSDSLDARALAY